MITLHNGNETIELLTDDNSYSYEAVMGDDTLTLYFSHPGYIDVPVGSWCEFYGKRYSLKKDSNFKKNGERNYSYTLVLETSKADTELWKIRNTVDNRIKFPYTAKPKEHLKLIVDNLNRRSSGWVIGDCIDGTEKLINYNHTVCLDALSQLAETYETEYQITETVIEGVHTKTVHLKKVEYNKDNPLTLSYGKGHGFKTGVGRESGDIPPEIILVETTDRNIDYSKYGAKELLMPKSQTIRYDGTRFEGEEGFNASASRTYKTDEYGTSVMRADRELTTSKEDSLDCTEIYPSRVGEVSEVTTINTEKHFYDFYDTGIPNNLNFEDCLIEGEKMTVIFQSGMLSGKEFEVKYTHVGRKFEIVPQEIDGITMPDGGVWMPEVGDKYAVFGVQLPEAYISDNATRTGASWDVFREAVKYLYEHEDKKFTFTGTLDGIWVKKRWLTVGGKIVLGGFVSFTDNQFHPEGSLIRIVGIKRYVNNPYSPEIELSNTPVGTSVASELNKIETNEVQVEENHKQALQFTKRYYRDAKETMEMLADSLLNFSGAINPITVATMQMLVGDESLQYRFVNSKTNPVVVNHDISYNSSTKVLNAPAGIIQHMTLGITSLSNTHAASDYKYWDMAEYNSPSLTNPEKKFYLYAKCSKDNQSGMFLLSETAIALEQIDGYYHLLVGILNSENNGERSFATLYGFTEILPGRVTTEKIVSSDGKTYFDLLKGEIAGYIRFLDGLIGTVGIGNETTINAGMSGEGNAGTDVRIWAGADKDGRWDAPYRVLHNGKLIGTDVDLKGKIDADSGNIGDFNISDGAISISRPNSGNGVLSMNLDVNGIALHNTSPSINVKMGLQQVQITDEVFYTPVFMEGRENFCGIYIRESFTDSNAIGVYSKYASIVLDNSPLVMQGSCPLIMYGKAVPAGGMYNNVWCTNQGGGTYEYYLPSSSDNRFGQMGSTIFVQNMNGDAWINTRNGETLRTLNGGSTTRWAFKNQYRLAIFHKLDYSTWTVNITE
nr:MAG TPA: tail protein [Bacteriophage sp.]